MYNEKQGGSATQRLLSWSRTMAINILYPFEQAVSLHWISVSAQYWLNVELCYSGLASPMLYNHRAGSHSQL
jgi:hypothetical protein